MQENNPTVKEEKNTCFVEHKSGIIAGLTLLIMALVAGYSFGYVHNLLVADTANLTLANIITHKTLFISEIIGWVVIFITDLIVAISLYYFFKRNSSGLSKATALMRILYTLILGIGIIHLIQILPSLSDTQLTESLRAQNIFSKISSFEKYWSIGLIIFGIHLFGLGLLVLKLKNASNLIGYLLLFGGVSYFVIHSFKNLNLLTVETITMLEQILSLPMMLSEMIFAIWLLNFGFRKKRIE